VYDRPKDLQDNAAPAAKRRWLVAGVAALICAPASAEPLRPVVSHDGVAVELTGYVQADAVPWSEDSIDELDAAGDPLNEERFLIRRARLRTEAHRGDLSGALEFDGNTANGATARLLGAQVNYGYKRIVTGTAGLFKIPFGAEVPANERTKPFLEPPTFARALFPGNYDAGVMVHGEYGLARYSVAMMNGAPVGDAQWHGVDPASSFELVGRLGASIDGPYRSHVDVGVSALTGSGLHAGTPPTKDELQWVDENQDGLVQTTELQVVPGTAGTPSQTFDRNALGFDVAVHWCLCVIGTGAAFAEVALATNLDRGVVYADPIATSRELRHLGYAIGVVQNVGDYAQVGVRYDRYDADRDAFEREGVDLVGIDKVFSTVSVMASGHLQTSRLLVQYDHERNPFGRNDAGMPTTRAADRVTLRAQVGF
jgi:hypothetical protein